MVLLGNCTKSYSFLQFINQVSSNVVIVRGEFDTGTIATTKNAKEELPINTVIKQGDFRIGCCNGYTVVPKNDPLSLLTFARQLDVDIVLWGGTHNVEAYTLEGKFFINPGSCTGAFTTDWPLQEPEKDVEKVQTGDIPKQSEETPDGGNGKPESQEGDPQPSAEDTKSNSTVTEKVPGADTTTEASKVEEAKPGLSSADPGTGEKDKDQESDGDDSDDDDFDETDLNGGCIPSFCLLDIQGSTCTLFIYTCVDGEVKVDKVVYKKE